MTPQLSSLPDPGVSSRAEILRGVRLAIPIVLGYLPLGFAYGVLAVKSDIPPLWVVVMSLLVFAGAGQLIAASMIGMGASVLSIVIATAMVNLRHILMSAALAGSVMPLSRTLRTLFALEVTDEVFAVHSTDFRHGARCNASRLFACNMTAHMGWVVGTATGVFSGSFVADVHPLGLDFALPAMFLGLLLPLCWERLHFLVAVTAALLSLCFNLLGTGRWSVIIATSIAATLGLWLSWRRDGGKGEQPTAIPLEVASEASLESAEQSADQSATLSEAHDDEGRTA